MSGEIDRSLAPYQKWYFRGQDLQRHRHINGYATLVLAGQYKEYSADGLMEVSTGQLVLHPPYHEHANCFLTEKIQLLSVEFPTGGMPGGCRHLSIKNWEELLHLSILIGIVHRSVRQNYWTSS